MPRDIEATRSRLLAAARDEFAQGGIGGARVDRIARQAGISKERIYGHFGNKEHLFEAVLEQALEEHAAALGLPGDDLVAYVGRIYDFHRAHPELLRLLLWEAQYHGATPVGDDEQRRAHYADKTRALAKGLGTTADRETAATLLTLIGLAAWPHAVPQLTALILGGPPEEANQIVRAQVMAFARQALSLTAIPPA